MSWEGGVVYLSSDRTAVTKYAENGGAVYEVLVADPKLYAEQREEQGLPQKATMYLRNVFVAVPEDVEIRNVMAQEKVRKLSRKERKRLRKEGKKK